MLWQESCGGGFSDLAPVEGTSQPGKNPTADAVSGDPAAGEGAAGGADVAGSASEGASADEPNPYAVDFYTDADKAPSVRSISIPATVEHIDLAFFQRFPNAVSIDVAPGSASYSSDNGLLLDAAQTNLLLVPEGMEGEAVLPSTLATVPACVFSRCTKLSAMTVPGSTATSAFTSSNGILYTSDMKTLVAAPAGIGASASIAPECTAIAEGAFWGNVDLKTIVATGNVQQIATGAETAGVSEDAAYVESYADSAPLAAFDQAAIRDATVVTADRAVWEAAGFTHFADPAEPGDTAEADGFAFTLLADGTVSVSWTGEGSAPEELIIPAAGAVANIEYRVSRIAEGAFADEQAVRSVVVPDSVTVVGKGAFNGCGNLADVHLGTSVTRIEAYAFRGTALRGLVLPQSLQYFGDEALADLSGTAIVATHSIGMVAHSVLAGSTGVAVYVPQREDGAYAWDTGVPTADNHVYPYALELSPDPLQLQVGQQADLFDGGAVAVPADVRVAFSYNANPVRVGEDGMVEGCKIGTSTVRASLLLGLQSGDHVLATASRPVEVSIAALPEEEPEAEDIAKEEPPAEEFETVASVPNELGEDTVEVFDYQTEDAVPMMYSTVRLSADSVARATYASTEIKTDRYDAAPTSQHYVHHEITQKSAGTVTTRGVTSATYSFSESAPANYRVTGTGSNGCKLDSTNYSHTFSMRYKISNSTASYDSPTVYGWSSTSSMSGLLTNGTCINNYATVYGLFPCVNLDAGRFDSTNKGTLFYDVPSTGATTQHDQVFTERFPYSYYVHGQYIEGKRLASDDVVQRWYATLGGVQNVGWSSSPDGDPIAFERLLSNYSFGTLYAVYPKFTAYLDNQGGSPRNATVDVRYGQPVPTVDIPTKTGYTFEGYYSEPGGEGDRYINGEGVGTRRWDINGDYDLYAYWAPQVFTVTLDFKKNGSGIVEYDYGQGLNGTDFDLYGTYSNPAAQTGWKFGRYSGNGDSPVIPLHDDDGARHVRMPIFQYGVEYHNLGYYSSALTTSASTPMGTRYISDLGYPNSSLELYGTYEGRPITSSITLYAHFAPNVTQVTLNKTANAPAGLITAGTTSYVYVHYQNGKYTSAACTTTLSEVVVPTAPEGYTFDGYYTAQSGGTQLIDKNGAYTSNFTNGYYSSNESGRATLYAHYSPIVTEVTLNKTTNTGAASNPGGTSTLYVKYNTGKYTTSSCATVLTQIEVPSLASGYAFKGYWTSTSGSGTQLIDEDGNYTSSFSNTYFKSQTGATLYARYARTTYQVTFNANKPSTASSSVQGTMSAQTMTYGTASELKENDYSLTGWTFTGWNTKSNGTGDHYSDMQTVTDLGAITLFAQWRATTHTVSFSANEGTGGQSDDVTATFDSTMPTISTTQPTRDGYTFMGWYDNRKYDASGAKQYYTSSCTSSVKYTLESNLTLYAGWRANTDTRYVVHHYQQNISDNNYTLKDAENLTGTTDTTASPSAKSYAGFTKVTTTLSNESGTIAGDGSLVLSFYYDRMTYTVSFVTNGGSNVDAQTIRYGGTVDSSKATTSRAGYTFGGWFKDADLTQAYNLGTAVTANLTLYAKLTANTDTPYKVEHYKQKVDGTYALYTTTAHQGTTDTQATAADKHQDFIGFHHVITGSSVESGTVAGEGTLVLKVYYDQNTYTIRFDDNGADGGSVPDGLTGVMYEQSWTIDSAKVPSRTGYTYRGWQKDGTGDVYVAGMPYTVPLTAEDGGTVILKAKWDNNPYRILLDANGGSPSDVIDAHYDQDWTIRADQVPHRRGYFFVGWSRTGADATTADYLMPQSGDLVCSDNLSTGDPATVTLFAVWQAQVYYIEFDANGAESGSVPDRIATFYTDQDPNVEIPVYGHASDNDLLMRKGAHVIGWSTDPADTDKASARGDWYEHGELVKNVGLDSNNRVPDGDINQHTVTLYAIWQVNTYTIIFQKNQGDYVTDDGGITQSARIMRDVAWGERYVIRETAVRGGFEFAGWEDENGEQVYDVGDVLENLTDEDGGIVLLFARWQGAPYRVYFDANGGTGQMWTSSEEGRYTNADGVEFFYDSSRKLYYTQMYFNVSTRLPLCGFWRDGYGFAGWTTERDDPASLSYRNGQLVVDLPTATGGGNEVTLYAFWEAQLNVSVPCIAVLQVDMDGMTGYSDGLPIVDVTDQFDTDGCASSFVSRTPEDTYLSWVSCIPVEEGLRTVFPGAEYNRREDGTLIGTNDVSIVIADKNNPEVRGAYNIGSDAGYKPTSNPFFKIPANGTLPLGYQLMVNRPGVEMGFRERPVQVAWLRYDISLVNKFTLNTE